jgi:hypothetical protein
MALLTTTIFTLQLRPGDDNPSAPALAIGNRKTSARDMVAVLLGNELAFSRQPQPMNLGEIGVISEPENLLGEQ